MRGKSCPEDPSAGAKGVATEPLRWGRDNQGEKEGSGRTGASDQKLAMGLTVRDPRPLVFWQPPKHYPTLAEPRTVHG